MRNLSTIISFAISLCSLAPLIGQHMNNANLEKIIYVVSDTMRGQEGAWEFYVDEVPMICITDEVNNRMRIIAPVIEVDKLDEGQKNEILEANFHSALDVRYALSDNLIWVAYIHPLKELSKEQAIDAISQVYSGFITFGTTYTSTSLTFPNNSPKEKKF